MDIIKDLDCRADMPVIHGHEDIPIYGTGRKLCPRYDGKRKTVYEQKIYLPHLLPLEEYDLIVVLFSAGKDSTAAFYKLIELGVPREKISLWHHDVDGGHPVRRMDWPVTQAYVKAFAEAEGVDKRISYRENGFFGELYRVGASSSVWYEDGGMMRPCPLTRQQIASNILRENGCDIEELRQYGGRMKFPAKSGDLSRRWCSVYLKISVADAVLCNLEQTKRDAKILIVSGERRAESAGRSRYNEMEVHRKNATAKARRIIHQWRNVIDYTEKDIWEVLKRHSVTPHPCYTCGWSRCSCAMCIFSLPTHWAGIRELFPAEYEAIRQDEIRLGFTLDNKKTLDEYVGDAKSCIHHGDPVALNQLISGEFTAKDIYTTEWRFPAGAFHGAAGGPC